MKTRYTVALATLAGFGLGAGQLMGSTLRASRGLTMSGPQPGPETGTGPIEMPGVKVGPAPPGGEYA